jgi:hypothetical protein
MKNLFLLFAYILGTTAKLLTTGGAKILHLLLKQQRFDLPPKPATNISTGPDTLAREHLLSDFSGTNTRPDT